MDDMINRNSSIAGENLDPNGRPAKNKFEEWSNEISTRTHLGYKEEEEVMSEEERERRIKEMDEIIKKDLE